MTKDVSEVESKELDAVAKHFVTRDEYKDLQDVAIPV